MRATITIELTDTPTVHQNTIHDGRTFLALWLGSLTVILPGFDKEAYAYARQLRNELTVALDAFDTRLIDEYVARDAYDTRTRDASQQFERTLDRCFGNDDDRR